MAVRITSVHMVGGSGHEHIAEVWWTDPADGDSNKSTVPQVIKYIDDGGKVYVDDGGHRVAVGVRRPQGRRAYIQTFADGVWTNNLLALPRY